MPIRIDYSNKENISNNNNEQQQQHQQEEVASSKWEAMDQLEVESEKQKEKEKEKEPSSSLNKVNPLKSNLPLPRKPFPISSTSS